jgi:hypothetical protein
MPADRITIPVKTINGESWGQLNVLAETHEFCGEKVKRKDENYTLSGGHRVRLYSFKKNVHWKIPAGVPLDIEQVPPASAPPSPRRLQR